MVIHPPVLFLGFASTLIPFFLCYCRDFDKTKRMDESPPCPRHTFSAGVLGVGIMMGAAWAYESLTFGGYWACDPGRKCVTGSLVDPDCLHSTLCLFINTVWLFFTIHLPLPYTFILFFVPYQSS